MKTTTRLLTLSCALALVMAGPLSVAQADDDRGFLFRVLNADWSEDDRDDDRDYDRDDDRDHDRDDDRDHDDGDDENDGDDSDDDDGDDD